MFLRNTAKSGRDKETLDMNCCFLDEEKFRICCQLLLQHSDTIRDGWNWEHVQSSEDGYLRKSPLWSGRVSCISDQDQRGGGPAPGQLTISLTRQDPPESKREQQMLAAEVAFDDNDDKDNDDDEDEDGVCCVSEGSSQVVQYEYHVLYSCSYQTPVLYFRASTLEGRSLSLEEVWNSVHPNYRLRLQQSPWDSITQQEHPLLGQPFFMLHPCRTEEFMRPVMQAAQQEHRQVNYVVTWLSVVGPVVGLDIPLSYSTQVPTPPLHPAPALHPAQGTSQTETEAVPGTYLSSPPWPSSPPFTGRQPD